MSLRPILVAASSIFIAFAALAAAPSPASAEEDHVVQFRFDADELAAPRGAERVFRRLDRAAKSACTNASRKTLRDAALERECTESLVAEFVEKIGDERLNALHAEASGASGASAAR